MQERDRQSHRRLQRYAVEWDAQCTIDGQTVEGRLLNVSMGGAFVELASPPSFNGTEMVELAVQTDFGRMRIKGRGRWTARDDGPGLNGFGLRFAEEPDARMQSWYRNRWYQELAQLN